MTLPEYRPIAAADRERTIAREGERGGVDVVIEFPETVDEEEERREEHMQTLYEIRLARQLERAATRESGDISAQQLQRPGSAASSVRIVPSEQLSSTQQLMAALTSLSERERKLSKVQYAEIGVARHDGTRVRPSMDSDRPLLEGGVPMTGASPSIRSSYMTHERNGSGTSYYGSAAHTPERRGSEEIIRMGSARPSMTGDDALRSSSGMLYPPPLFTPHPAPIDYDGSEWGPPPGYTSPTESRNNGPDGLPILRIDTGTPVEGGIRSVHSPQLPQRLHSR